jgi:hypothetical protein
MDNFFTKLNNCIDVAENAEDAFFAMRQLSLDRDNEPRMAYVSVGSLLKKFSQSSVISAVNVFIYFDEDDYGPNVKRAIQRTAIKMKKWVGTDLVKEDVLNKGIGAFRTEDLLYVIHACVKQDGNNWQCTTFGKGLTQPIGDTARADLDHLLGNSATSAAIPFSATQVKFEDLEQLMMNEFAVVSQVRSLSSRIDEIVSDYEEKISEEQLTGLLSSRLSGWFNVTLTVDDIESVGGYLKSTKIAELIEQKSQQIKSRDLSENKEGISITQSNKLKIV